MKSVLRDNPDAIVYPALRKYGTSQEQKYKNQK